jgi:hypothetical protein
MNLTMNPLKIRLVNWLKPHTDPFVVAYTAQDYATLAKLIGRLTAKTLYVAMAIFLAYLVFTHLPVTSRDWQTFRKAALLWPDPYYREAMIFNPPWLFLLLYPLAALPHPAGVGVLIMISILAVALYTGSAKKAFFVAASAGLGGIIVLGQLDALLLYGLLIPYGLGIPLLLTKPQGVFLAIIPRLNRWSMLLTLLVMGISVLVWGEWWWHILAHQPNPKGNLSLFPYSIVLGIPLVYWGLKRKSDALLCSASLCFAPYFMAHSLLPAIAAIIRETDDWRWWSALVVGSWLYVAAMGGFLW